MAREVVEKEGGREVATEGVEREVGWEVTTEREESGVSTADVPEVEG